MNRCHPARQRGWIGILGFLIALAILAVLAQTVLRRYGLLSDAESVDRGAPRAMSAVGPAPGDANAAAPAPTAPLDRARGLERDAQRGAQGLAGRIDESTK